MTTYDDLEYISQQIVTCTNNILKGYRSLSIMGTLVNYDELLQESDRLLSIQTRLLKTIGDEHHILKIEKFSAVDELNEANESVRLLKIRDRRSSRGLSIDDFIHWSSGHSIKNGKTILTDIHSYHCEMGDLYGFNEYCKVKVDMTKTWSLC